MSMVGIIGLLLAIAILIFGAYKGLGALPLTMIAALVAGVPSPLRSASSGISSFPAVSMAARRVSSVYALGGAVRCSVTAASTRSKS